MALLERLQLPLNALALRDFGGQQLLELQSHVVFPAVLGAGGLEALQKVRLAGLAFGPLFVQGLPQLVDLALELFRVGLELGALVGQGFDLGTRLLGLARRLCEPAGGTPLHLAASGLALGLGQPALGLLELALSLGRLLLGRFRSLLGQGRLLLALSEPALRLGNVSLELDALPLQEVTQPGGGHGMVGVGTRTPAGAPPTHEIRSEPRKPAPPVTRTRTMRGYPTWVGQRSDGISFAAPPLEEEGALLGSQPIA